MTSTDTRSRIRRQQRTAMRRARRALEPRHPAEPHFVYWLDGRPHTVRISRLSKRAQDGALHATLGQAIVGLREVRSFIARLRGAQEAGQ